MKYLSYFTIINILSAPEIDEEKYFSNNSRTKVASDLRFSPFSRGPCGASIYVRNDERTNGPSWLVYDGHFENAVTILAFYEFGIKRCPFDRDNCPLSNCARPTSLARSVEELDAFF